MSTFRCETSISFRITCDYTKPGQSLAICGSHPRLGGWNIDKCLLLETKSDHFPVWTSENINLNVTLGGVVFYRYCVVEKINEPNIGASAERAGSSMTLAAIDTPGQRFKLVGCHSIRVLRPSKQRLHVIEDRLIERRTRGTDRSRLITDVGERERSDSLSWPSTGGPPSHQDQTCLSSREVSATGPVFSQLPEPVERSGGQSTSRDLAFERNISEESILSPESVVPCEWIAKLDHAASNDKGLTRADHSIIASLFLPVIVAERVGVFGSTHRESVRDELELDYASRDSQSPVTSKLHSMESLCEDDEILTTTERFYVLLDRSVLLPSLLSLALRNGDGDSARVNESSDILPLGSFKFVGLVSVEKAKELSPLEIAQIHSALNSVGCRGIIYELLPDTVQMGLRFIHSYLVPSFHGLFSGGSVQEASFPESGWMAYLRLIAVFADTLSILVTEKHLVWLHDISMMMLPHYLLRKVKVPLTMGLFLHTTFPPVESLACNPYADFILRSILLCNLVGFHFYHYARHFLSAVQKILNKSYNLNFGGTCTIEYSGRVCQLFVGHANVDYPRIKQFVSDNSRLRNMTDNLRQKLLPDRLIIASVDKTHTMSGIMLKLRSFTHFLKTYEAYSSNVILIQALVPTLCSQNGLLTTISDYCSTAFDEEATLIVHSLSELDAKNLDNVKVIIRTGPLNSTEKYAIYRAADLFFTTSIQDGLNVNPFEFVAVREADNPAPLVLSQFVGSAVQLASAFRFNPYHVEGTSAALDAAINADIQKLQEKCNRDLLFLEEHSLSAWAGKFLSVLKRFQAKNVLPTSKPLMAIGLGRTLRFRADGVNTQPLDKARLIASYRQSRRRLIILDNEGTLIPDRRIFSFSTRHQLTAFGTPPSEEVISYLKRIGSHEGTYLHVVSGRPRSLMLKWFGEISSQAGLCAEHGFYMWLPYLKPDRMNVDANSPVQWAQLLAQGQSGELRGWRELVMSVMKLYVDNTPGAFIENKGASLVFQYRNADPELGALQSKDLKLQLLELLREANMEVNSGKGYVEATLKGVNKGECAALLCRAVPDVDFILAIGDDRSDELTFGAIQDYVMAADMVENIYTASVGKKPSKAKYYLEDPDDVTRLLSSLAEIDHEKSFI